MSLRETLVQVRKMQFFKEKKLFFLFLFSLSLNIFSWFYVLVIRPGLLSKIPLIGLIILIINFILGFRLYLNQKKSLTEMLFYSFLIVQLILLTGLLINP